MINPLNKFLNKIKTGLVKFFDWLTVTQGDEYLASKYEMMNKLSMSHFKKIIRKDIRDLGQFGFLEVLERWRGRKEYFFVLLPSFLKSRFTWKPLLVKRII